MKIEPAFPSPFVASRDGNILNGSDLGLSVGISNRLFVATHAMQGILSNPELFANISKIKAAGISQEEAIAIAAFECADALIRKESNP